MKYLQSYNESLRDKMTPKSKEEIDDKLKNYSSGDKLLMACSKGLLWLVKDITESGYDINRAGSYALELAIVKGHHDIVHYLVDQGSYIYPKFLDIAREVGRYEIADYLEQHMRTNESLRDKMTPKSDEEIMDILNANPDVSYKALKGGLAGTWMIGEYKCSYYDLVKLFGEPHLEDWIGNNFMWKLKADNDHIVTIYDNGSGLEGYEIMEMDYKWHIGGTDPKDANDLIGYIIRNTN